MEPAFYNVQKVLFPIDKNKFVNYAKALVQIQNVRMRRYTQYLLTIVWMMIVKTNICYNCYLLNLSSLEITILK